MRIAFGAGALGACLLMSGCSLFHHKAASSSGPAGMSQPPAIQTRQPPPETRPVIKPDLRSAGQVAMVNGEAHFVVIRFDTGGVPQAGEHLSIYRDGQKVGQVTVTGPQHENDTVADIVTGDIQVHDEARAE